MIFRYRAVSDEGKAAFKDFNKTISALTLRQRTTFWMFFRVRIKGEGVLEFEPLNMAKHLVTAHARMLITGMFSEHLKETLDYTVEEVDAARS